MWLLQCLRARGGGEGRPLVPPVRSRCPAACGRATTTTWRRQTKEERQGGTTTRSNQEEFGSHHPCCHPEQPMVRLGRACKAPPSSSFSSSTAARTRRRTSPSPPPPPVAAFLHPYHSRLIRDARNMFYSRHSSPAEEVPPDRRSSNAAGNPPLHTSSTEEQNSPRSALSLTSVAGELRPPSGTMSRRSHPVGDPRGGRSGQASTIAPRDDFSRHSPVPQARGRLSLRAPCRIPPMTAPAASPPIDSAKARPSATFRFERMK